MPLYILLFPLTLSHNDAQNKAGTFQEQHDIFKQPHMQLQMEPKARSVNASSSVSCVLDPLASVAVITISAVQCFDTLVCLLKIIL